MSHMQRKKKARKQRQLWGTGAGEIPCGFGLFSWQQTAAVLLLGSPCICFLQLSCLRMEPRFRLYALDILSEKDFHSLIPRGLQFHKGGSCVGKEGSWWLLLPGPHRTRSEGSYLLLSESFFLPLPCLASPIALVQSCSPVIQHSSLPISYFHIFFSFFFSDDDWIFTGKSSASRSSLEINQFPWLWDSQTKQVLHIPMVY